MDSSECVLVRLVYMYSHVHVTMKYIACLMTQVYMSIDAPM